MLGWPTGWRQKADEHVFLQAIKAVAAGRMALLVPKGTQFFPDSQDRVSGCIDIW
jgi:potassium/chloride transporter 4/5/6